MRMLFLLSKLQFSYLPWSVQIFKFPFIFQATAASHNTLLTNCSEKQFTSCKVSASQRQRFTLFYINSKSLSSLPLFMQSSSEFADSHLEAMGQRSLWHKKSFLKPNSPTGQKGIPYRCFTNNCISKPQILLSLNPEKVAREKNTFSLKYLPLLCSVLVMI